MSNPYEYTGKMINDVRPAAQEMFQGAVHFVNGQHQMPTNAYAPAREHIVSGVRWFVDAARTYLR
ncbi:hypothetical protein ACFQ7M_38315 [Streptomyces massasporeus]